MYICVCGYLYVNTGKMCEQKNNVNRGLSGKKCTRLPPSTGDAGWTGQLPLRPRGRDRLCLWADTAIYRPLDAFRSVGSACPCPEI